MKPPPFEYFAPGSLEEALGLFEQHGDAARPLAGGQSLVPAMNFRLSRPEVLVDLNGVDELQGIENGADGALVVGAMTRQRALERWPGLDSSSPLVAETLPWIAHPQIRNRGTVGGSLAHADPAAELPAVAVALDASFVLQSTRGRRRVAARDFYVALFETALEPGEILVSVELPGVTTRARTAFAEVARRHGDFALVGVAAWVGFSDADVVEAARLVFLSVGDGPVLAEQASRQLIGATLAPASIEAAAASVAAELEPAGDIHASEKFRRHLAAVLTRRVLERVAPP